MNFSNASSSASSRRSACAVPLGVAAPGTFDQNASHGLGRRAEEVRAIPPGRLRVTAQSKPGFMQERSGLECLPGRLPCHLRGGKFAEFAINEREQLVGGVCVAAFDPPQDEGDLAGVHDGPIVAKVENELRSKLAAEQPRICLASIRF